MSEDLRQLFMRYKAVIFYLFFGVCTTIVNVAVYYICAHWFDWEVMPSTIIAWAAAVLFAYITNRKWVFESEVKTASGIAKETGKFFGCRLATGLTDWLCMFVFVDLLALNDMIIKMASNILVIILNYLASRLVIFRKTNNNSKNY